MDFCSISSSVPIDVSQHSTAQAASFPVEKVSRLCKIDYQVIYQSC